MPYPPGPPAPNPITAMDPELRGLLRALNECTADQAASLADVVRVTDRVLACFNKLEVQRTRELAEIDPQPASDWPRCSVAAAATDGAYHCTRDRGHEGPCAAVPVVAEVKPWEPPVLKPLNIPHGITGALNDVWSFHTAMDLPVLDSSAPQWPGDDRAQLRWALIREECDEVAQALGVDSSGIVHRKGVLDTQPRKQLCDFADGLADLIYVCVGAALEFGIPLGEVWAEVQRANRAKQGGPVRADGKRLKPEGWQPPNIERAVFGSRVDGHEPDIG